MPIAVARKISKVTKVLVLESAIGQSINPKIPANVPYAGTHFFTGLSLTQLMLMMMWHNHAIRTSKPTSVPPSDLMPDIAVTIRDPKMPYEESR